MNLVVLSLASSCKAFIADRTMEWEGSVIQQVLVVKSDPTKAFLARGTNELGLVIGWRGRVDAMTTYHVSAKCLGVRIGGLADGANGRLVICSRWRRKLSPQLQDLVLVLKMFDQSLSLIVRFVAHMTGVRSLVDVQLGTSTRGIVRSCNRKTLDNLRNVVILAVVFFQLILFQERYATCVAGVIADLQTLLPLPFRFNGRCPEIIYTDIGNQCSDIFVCLTTLTFPFSGLFEVVLEISLCCAF